MKIASSTIQFSSQRSSLEYNKREESLRMWVGDRNQATSQPTNSNENLIGTPRAGGAFQSSQTQISARIDSVSLSSSVTEAAAKAEMTDGINEIEEADDAAELNLDVQSRAFKLLVEYFTGKKLKIMTSKDLEVNSNAFSPQASSADQPTEQSAQQPQEREGWGLEYDYHEVHFESEKTTFQASGIINTADGQAIEIDLELAMSREFMEEHRVQVRAGDAQLKDPLVINFGGTAAQLESTKFSFDIDADGTEEQISFLKSGSGFLAVDKNGDGSINDGSELFGALTGDGFKELATFDEDDNNWIDANDSIYEKLRIWFRDENGDDKLVGLGQKGIGAIYLDHVGTKFSINDEHNKQHGQIDSTGVYLRKDMSVGTVQKIDLVA